MNTTATILLVDDNENDISLFRMAAEQAGMRNPLSEVHNGEEAIAYLAGTAAYEDRSQYPLPILILLDLKMPKKNGFEVLAWLKDQPVLSRIPVFILSASLQADDANQAFDLYANAFLVKPSTIDDLIEMIRTMIQWISYNHFPEIYR